MKEKAKRKAGRAPKPEGERKVQRTVTISPEAEKIVVDNTTVKGKPHYDNASSFVESCILSHQ